MRLSRRIQFEASSEREAIEIARRRLGQDAVILSTRWVRKGGFLGLFSRQVLEVVAGLYEEDEAPRAAEEVSRTLEFQKLLMRKAYEAAKEGGPGGGGAKPASSASRLEEEVRELREALRSVLERLSGEGEVPLLPASLRPLYRKLLSNDVAPSVAEEVLKDFASSRPRACEGPAGAVEEELFGFVQGLFRPFPGFPPGPGRVVVFVGPTGVGKTTTIAKLAAINTLYEGKRVSLITTDTYRVAAVEQLRTYARIIGIPIEVVFTPRDMVEAVSRQRGSDLILVDTAGRSQRDSLRVSELKAYVEVLEDPVVELVVSANTKYRDVLEVVDRFGVVPIHHFVFTKLDETNTYGTLLNVCFDFGRPISYLTTGQNVPNDIEMAEPVRLASLVLGRERVERGP